MKVSKTQEYIVALLEGREFEIKVKLSTITKEQLQTLWKEGKIPKDAILGKKWKVFADAWNTENTTDYGYIFPTSIF